MCLIGLAAGLRFSKVLGLSWEGINFNQKILRVNRSFDHSYSRKFKDTKSDTSKRTIVIDEPTINLLIMQLTKYCVVHVLEQIYKK